VPFVLLSYVQITAFRNPREGGDLVLLACDRWIEIIPIRVHFLYLPDFPCPIPFLHLALSRKRRIQAVQHLVIDQARGSIPLRKSVDCFDPMLIRPCDQISRRAYVQNAVFPAC
jgi:hypothetical protein